MSESFNWSSVAPLMDHYLDVALEDFHTGKSFPQIAERLRGLGLTDDRVKAVTADLAQNRAYAMLSAGKKETDVVHTLIQRGLSARVADEAARQAARQRGRTMASAGDGVWKMRALMWGTALLGAGLLLMWSDSIFGIEIPVLVYAPVLLAGGLLLAYGGIYILIV